VGIVLLRFLCHWSVFHHVLGDGPVFEGKTGSCLGTRISDPLRRLCSYLIPIEAHSTLSFQSLAFLCEYFSGGAAFFAPCLARGLADCLDTGRSVYVCSRSGVGVKQIAGGELAAEHAADDILKIVTLVLTKNLTALPGCPRTAAGGVVAWFSHLEAFLPDFDHLDGNEGRWLRHNILHFVHSSHR